MPVPYQIIPPGSLSRPKIYTVINDNTLIEPTLAIGGGAAAAVMCIFASPKGPDRVVTTISEGISQFNDLFGLGPFSLYGQPLLNAYTAASAATTTNSMVHCLRVTADNATYSVATLIAKYKEVTETVEAVDVTSLHIKYEVVPSVVDITDLDNLDLAYIPATVPDAEGYSEVKLFSMAYAGRGSYGKNIRFRITTEREVDKLNDYKNYNLAIYRNEGTLEQVDNQVVSFVPDAIYLSESIFADDLFNEDSKYIRMLTFSEGFTTLYDAYKEVVPDTTFTINDFDPLLGIDKYTRGMITNLVIEPASGSTPSATGTPVDLSSTSAIGLLGGSDGDLDPSNPNRDVALEALYMKAFTGEMDERIKSKNRFPTTQILDANFPVPVKKAMVALGAFRGDCMVALDGGTELYTKGSVQPYYETNFKAEINDRNVVFDAICGKVRDPYSNKVVTVTYTYERALSMFGQFYTNGGKQVPMAGNQYGIINGFIENSIYPVFEDDLDVDMLDILADYHVNYAKYNPNQIVVRGTQNTLQKILSNLTEENNCLILLDVKRDCERLSANFEYDFASPANLARFNASLSTIVDKYAGTQLSSLEARYSNNTWEAARGIIHLYVSMVHYDLVKTTIIEIDVNRATS